MCFSAFDFESFFGNQPNAVSMQSSGGLPEVDIMDKGMENVKTDVGGAGCIIGLVMIHLNST